MDITSLHALYQSGELTPSALVEQLFKQIESESLRPVWISLAPKQQCLAHAKSLESSNTRDNLPLFGIPFAVKDNIDVAGLPTTAGCPAYAYQPSASATVVERLEAAGALLIGKTNMDQFATGLVGTRSPYGACSSVFNSEYVSGGSSSGSAVSVAKGLVSFSLGTDTAGSGRVPAAFNQLVGLKPTRGWISAAGVVPACRTLDCVSVFAETCGDATKVFEVLRGFDPKDAYSRTPAPGNNAAPWAAKKSTSSFRFGIPKQETLNFFGDESAAACYQAAIHALSGLGGEAVEIDYAPFRATAELLYSGPWVAERLAAIYDFANAHAEDMDPTVRQIITGASRFNAVDTFRSEYRLAELKQITTSIVAQVDFLFLPTTPTAYKISEVQASPIQLNSNLGYYTNFVNLLDLAAVAIPAGFKPEGMPFGASLIGPAFTDDSLLRVADTLHRKLATTLGGSKRLLSNTPSLSSPATPEGCVLMAVVGAHLTGQPLNWQLTQRKARLICTTRTEPDYRFYVLPNSTPAKPGLIYEPGFKGPGIEVEVWAMPEDTAGTFINAIPAPLSIGTLRLEDGQQVKGFLCEPAGIAGAQEITQLGGWRRYLKTQSQIR